MPDPTAVYSALEKLAEEGDPIALSALLLNDALDTIRIQVEYVTTAVEGVAELGIKIEEVSKSIASLEDEFNKR